MTIPQVEFHLPALMPFVHILAREYMCGELQSWPMMAQKVRRFFTPAMIDKVEATLPGWRAMSAPDDGTTLIHVVTALVALVLGSEYRQSSPERQTLMQWIVLLHDLGKEIQPGGRDHMHGFRSAALAGRILPRLGFAVTGTYTEHIERWAALTMAATTPHPETPEAIPDNRKLPEIIAGIDQLFGQHTPAALVVKTVLFHLSLDVLSEWPPAAPLAGDEMRQFLDKDLLPLLEIMTLADNDAWAFFDAETRKRHREETLAAFEAVRRNVLEYR